MSEIHSFGVEPITSHAFNASKDSNTASNVFAPVSNGFYLQNWLYRQTTMKSTSIINRMENGP